MLRQEAEYRKVLRWKGGRWWMGGTVSRAGSTQRHDEHIRRGAAGFVVAIRVHVEWRGLEGASKEVWKQFEQKMASSLGHESDCE